MMGGSESHDECRNRLDALLVHLMKSSIGSLPSREVRDLLAVDLCP